MKKPWNSKMNWLGLAMTLAGLLSDPSFHQYLGDLVPPTVLPKVLSGCGMLVMVLRTCCTSQSVSMKGNKATGP